MLDVSAYFDRIGYSGPISPTTETLCALHHAHLLTVPFENLDIGLGKRILLDEGAMLRKIVEQRRGGFCYELNGAFAALLRALGFRVTLLSARVSRESVGESPEFDHLTLLVDLQEQWLADVGFGELFLEPLRIEPGIQQNDPAGMFRLTEQGDRRQLEKSLDGGSWKREYSFSLQPRALQDFEPRCRYHQTSPESHFTQNRICTRATPEGRITLSENTLIETRNGHRKERLLSSDTEREEVLQEYFGVRL